MILSKENIEKLLSIENKKSMILEGLSKKDTSMLMEHAAIKGVNITDLEEAQYFLMDYGNSKEKLDSNYLVTYYSLKIGDKNFCTSSSQYRKDGGLCDSQWDEEIWIENVKKKK